ncbi:MAG: hypothetical protein LBE05_02120 [Microbacterium sp.]|jgi:hypothetical protein|nr:hypothetical protein [Microbacterium sp.]
MSGLEEADRAERMRLQRAVYGPGASADAGIAQERLRALESSRPEETRPDAPRRAAIGLPTAEPAPGTAPALPRVQAVAAPLRGQRTLSRAERVLWAGLGALAVAMLTVVGFFLGALTAPHPDRVLIPVVEAAEGRVAHEDVTDYREYVADRMKIGIGTTAFDGPGAMRCLYVAGPDADLRTETLLGACAPESAFGTTWEVPGDLGTGSALFGLTVQDSVRFIERDSGLEVWLSEEPA